MGLIKNAINFGNGFNIGAVAPIDSRMRVEKVSDLTSVWTAEIPAYKGMIVTVMETSDVYVLKDAENYTSPDSWVKLGSASSAADGAADALKQAKDYTDQEVKKLADNAVKTNTDKIATLNGDANTDGSVAYAVSAEKTRAMAAEKANADAIAAETAAREAAINLLDANVTSTSGTHVTVNVIEDNGVVTAVNVTESDIASASALTAEISARQEAVSGLTEDISDEVTRATQAEAGLSRRVTVNETAIATEKSRAEGKESELATAISDENTRATSKEGELAESIDTEKSRAEGKEGKLAESIATEKSRAEGAESALDTRLDVIEGKGEGSINKALADAKSYTKTQIDGLTSTVTGDGTHVDVTVAQKNGVITAVTVSESDIASAAVLAKVKGDVDNFFKDASFSENAKDTLKELQEYINTDAAGALTMETAIANNKTAIENEVSRAKAAEQENATAIATLNGDVNKDGSVAKAVATETTRAQGEELKLNNAITAETQNRTNAINALNANVNSTGGSHVIVNVTEDKGIITSVTVTESGIAKASELDALEAAVGNGFSADKTVAKAIADNAKAITDETKAREDDDKAINAKIGTVETGKTVVGMINEAKAAAIAASTVVAENSDFITITKTGEVGKTQTYTITTQDVASATATTNAINAEVTRAKAAEKANADAIAAETQTRASEDTAIKGRLDILERVTVTGKNAIAVTASGATESKVVSLKLGTQPAEGVAGVVLSQNADGLVAKLQWGTF